MCMLRTAISVYARARYCVRYSFASGSLCQRFAETSSTSILITITVITGITITAATRTTTDDEDYEDDDDDDDDPY